MSDTKLTPAGLSAQMCARIAHDLISPIAALGTAIKLTLSGKMPEDGFDGRTIQPFYAGMILRELGGKIAAGADEERVVFSAKIPLV